MVESNSRDETERARDIYGFIRLSALAYLWPICMLFILVDYFWYPQFLRLFGIVRLGELSCVLMFLRYAKSERVARMQWLFALYIALIASEIHFVIFTVHDPSTPYYTTLVMLLVALAGELGTSWRWYAFNVAQTIGPYLILGACTTTAEQRPAFILNLFFLASIAGIATVGRMFARRLQFRGRQLRRELEHEVDVRNRIIARKTRETVELHSRRAKLNEEIVRANERLTITEQVAHDIRSPLSALQVTVAHAPGLSVEYRDLVRDAVARIAGIADDLLSRARTERRSLATQKTPLALSIRQILAEKRSRHGDQIRFESELNELIVTEVDASAFQRVLSNLIDNSVEASAAGTMIQVVLESVSNRIEVRVIDQGHGMDPSIVAQLGRRGGSFGKSHGSGLGLFHAKEFARNAGGELLVRSEIGKGTTVILVLPQSAAVRNMQTS